MPTQNPDSVVNSPPKRRHNRKSKKEKKTTANSSLHSPVPPISAVERLEGVDGRDTSLPANTKDVMEIMHNLSLHTPSPQPLKQQGFIGSYLGGSTGTTQNGNRADEYDPTSPITNNSYNPKASQVHPNSIQGNIPYSPMYNYYGTPQYPPYPVPSTSPYWPYDAPQIPYNGFNFFSPNFPPQTYWQPYPHPIPSASGTIRIDSLPPSQQAPTSTPPSPPPTLPQIPHIPEPSPDYILTSSLPPFRLDTPNKKLLILDLNGTLLHRPRNPSVKDRTVDMRRASQKPHLRPHLTEFMTYIFRHYKIMFWSSATPRNVHSMIAAVATPEQRAQLVGVWGRDTLGLSEKEYNKKSITFKDLRKVFEDDKLGGGGGVGGSKGGSNGM